MVSLKRMWTEVDRHDDVSTMPVSDKYSILMSLRREVDGQGSANVPLTWPGRCFKSLPYPMAVQKEGVRQLPTVP